MAALNLKDEGENFANSERTEKPGHTTEPKVRAYELCYQLLAGLQKALTMNNI